MAAVFFSGQPIGQPNILDYLRVTPFPTNIKKDIGISDTSLWYLRHRKPFPGSKQMDLSYLAYPPLKLAEVGKSYQHENIMNKENNVKDNDENTGNT